MHFLARKTLEHLPQRIVLCGALLLVLGLLLRVSALPTPLVRSAAHNSQPRNTINRPNQQLRPAQVVSTVNAHSMRGGW